MSLSALDLSAPPHVTDGHGFQAPGTYVPQYRSRPELVVDAFVDDDSGTARSSVLSLFLQQQDGHLRHSHFTAPAPS